MTDSTYRPVWPENANANDRRILAREIESNEYETLESEYAEMLKRALEVK